MGTEKSIVYFEKSGEDNTGEVLKLARRRAEELGIKDIVVASTHGNTGAKASEFFKGYNLVVVSHCAGYKEPGSQELTEENRRIIEKNGGRILTCMHTFQGIERAIRNTFNTAYPIEIMAQTLKLFGDGTKVVVEVVAMAADAGLIAVDKDVIGMGGSHSGADTALVIKPANSIRIFDIMIKEIIAKPRGKLSSHHESSVHSH